MRFFSTITFTIAIIFVHATNGLAQSVLASEFEQFERYVEKRDSIAPDVSAVNVAWHLDHLLKVINGISSQVDSSDPATYESNYKFIRTVVFTSGRMPRGVGKAPESVRPPEVILTEDIYKQLSSAKKALDNFSTLDKRQYFNHPVFGTLNRNRSRRFLKIHTRHHLRIIRDIVASSGGSK